MVSEIKIPNVNFMKMQEKKNSGIRVIIPNENYTLINTSRKGLPAVVVLNKSLRGFNYKSIFGWACTIRIMLKVLAENGMPTYEESCIALDFFDSLDSTIKGNDVHPNALFVSRITNDGILEANWQLNDPGIVDKQLQSIIKGKTYPRDFDYEIRYDEEWDRIKWYLQDFSTDESV